MKIIAEVSLKDDEVEGSDGEEMIKEMLNEGCERIQSRFTSMVSGFYVSTKIDVEEQIARDRVRFPTPQLQMEHLVFTLEDDASEDHEA